MSNTTANLGLTLPSETDSYDVNVTNGNFEEVDRAIGELQNNSATQETLNGISADIASVKTATEANGEKADILQVYAASIKSTVEANAVNIDILKTALNTANANISVLLTQNRGVKAIVSGQVTTPTGNPSTASATIPDTMNAEKVVIIATAHSTASNIDSGIAWVRDGHKVTFTANNKVISYQFIEFD